MFCPVHNAPLKFHAWTPNMNAKSFEQPIYFGPGYLSLQV